MKNIEARDLILDTAVTLYVSPEEKLRLTHMPEAAALIGRYVEDISKREFLEDTLRQDAVMLWKFGNAPSEFQVH